jgi:hypothetical protein
MTSIKDLRLIELRVTIWDFIDFLKTVRVGS